jgi:anaerobic selenocysteine-containing dehydrogenase
MNSEGMVRSTCEFCDQGCGVLVHIADGRPVEVTGDPINPVSRGVLCAKGAASLEYLNHHQRLKYPLRRAGARGEGRWQRVSWDEAFDEIAGRLTEIKVRYGARSVAFMRGAAKGYQDVYTARFANAFGSPNISAMSQLCYVCRANALTLTNGAILFPDYEFPPALVLMWGKNTHNTAVAEWKRTTDALDRGSKLIVIDPWQSEPARRADVWVKPRPCTDLALALGMLNVVVNEDLYDHEFVERWTVGFDKLRDHVQGYPPERMAEVSWVPADTIEQIARMYATNKPACLTLGNGVDNNINNFQMCRAASILRAITGNIGRPGADLEWSPSGITPKGYPGLDVREAIPAETRAARLNGNDGFLPMVFYSLPHTIFEAIRTGRPYPIKAAFVQGANLLVSLPGSNETLDALQRLDYLVVADLFMTPTAELADIVLPVASYLEIDSVHEGEFMLAVTAIQKVASVGECRSDYQICSGLAKRMGLEKYFDTTDKEMLDFLLKPTGLTFDEFRKIGVVSGSKQYRKHERTGFNTPSKKVELYSQRLAEWGFDPLPVYQEPPDSPVSEPELAKKYPFVLTCRKPAPFMHCQGRMIESLRELHPEPIVYVQTDAAKGLGIEEGDWVYIETRYGRIREKANLVSAIDRRVIVADGGWWFPEKDAASLHGWAESNYNVLTRGGGPWSREMGSPTLRGIICNVGKAAH